MIVGFRSLLIIAFIFLSNATHAFIRLDPEFHNRPLSPAELKRWNQFSEEVVSVLPTRLKANLPLQIRVNLIPSKAAPGPLPDLCSGKPFVAARSRLGENEILIQEFVLNEILKEPKESIKLMCSHHDTYQLSKAIILHELGHFYDYNYLQNGKVAREGQVSRSFPLVNLMGWENKGLWIKTLEQTNHFYQASPDPYEFKSPEESFAVNLEYFLLDPQYGCRKPVLYAELAKHFGQRPFEKTYCRINPTVYVSPLGLNEIQKAMTSIDLNRLYQVHFLLASKGDSVNTRWGHSMLRLVMCRPDRTKIGPECLTQDLEHHLVIGYRANPQGVMVNNLKLLQGGYPSQVFVFKMVDILNRYTQDEFRELLSLPIILTQTERKKLVYRILDQYWSYKGDYALFKTNCATELATLLRGVIQPERVPELKTLDPVTPRTLLQKLIRLQVVSDLGIANQKLEVDQSDKKRLEGYYFPSILEALKSKFSQLRSYAPSLRKSKLKEFLEQTLPEDRLQAYTGAVLERNEVTEYSNRIKIAALFYNFEAQILRVNQWELIQKAQKDFIKLHKKDGALERLTDLQKQIGMVYPLRGYGIPLEQEIELQKTVQEPIQVHFTETDEFQAKYQGKIIETRKSIENLTYFKKEIVEYGLREKEVSKRNVKK